LAIGPLDQAYPVARAADGSGGAGWCAGGSLSGGRLGMRPGGLAHVWASKEVKAYPVARAAGGPGGAGGMVRRRRAQRRPA